MSNEDEECEESEGAVNDPDGDNCDEKGADEDEETEDEGEGEGEEGADGDEEDVEEFVADVIDGAKRLCCAYEPRRAGLSFTVAEEDVFFAGSKEVLEPL